ncbi:hypothetical protein [Bacillus cereus]|uniref:hypothetical protein n=1 Tax=Bacillus cereus TaxID=1396 RepID=UPI0021122DAC|nr:hypothetical protein [Bacillus cereus]
MENNQEKLKLFSEIVASLTETKKEIFKCLSDEKIDDKLKEKMFKHVRKIDKLLLGEGEDIYQTVIKKAEKMEFNELFLQNK